MSNPVLDALIAVKPDLDKARKWADAFKATVDTLDSSFLGHLVAIVPAAGAVINAGLTGVSIVVSALDAVDGVIDAYSPGATPVAPPSAAIPK